MSTAAAALAAVVGGDWVRDATPDDAVAGAQPSLVVEPASEDEVAEVLRLASRDRLAVAPRGGGSKLGWGSTPRQCDVVLSTLRLDSLIEHESGDLVCVAGAGMRLETLQQKLQDASGQTQRLMLDPPAPGNQTVGGIVACNAAGGLRTRYGTPRDLLLGARFVLSDGTVGHSGGKVVKNVAGYDVARLLAGSLGALAVITQTALRLHPVPQAEGTVVVDNASAARLASAVDELRLAPAVIAAADVLWPEGTLVVRVEGTPSGVDEQCAALSARVAGRRLAQPQATVLCERLVHAPWDGEGTVVGIGIPRSQLAGLLAACSDFAAEAVVRACTGTGEARITNDEVVRPFRRAVERLGGHLAVHRGGPSLADAAWGRCDAVSLDLMRSVKSRFDASSTLSPGRHVGAI